MSDMRDISIEKIVLNMGLGADGNMEHAITVLNMVTGRKPVITTAHKRNPFGVSKGKKIGCMVTVRKGCNELLKRFLEAKENKLKVSSFDRNGNFSFGISEYINIPNMEYDPKIGIMGFDVCVTLKRPGFRIKYRRIPSKIGKKHRITSEEAMKFMKEKFSVDLVE